MFCQKQVSREGTSNYIPQYLWDVITCPWPSYLLPAQHSSNINTTKHKYKCKQNTMTLFAAVMAYILYDCIHILTSSFILNLNRSSTPNLEESGLTSFQTTRPCAICQITDMSSSPAISYINIARVTDSTYLSHLSVFIHTWKKKWNKSILGNHVYYKKMGSWLSWGATFCTNLFAATSISKNHIFLLNWELWVKNFGEKIPISERWSMSHAFDDSSSTGHHQMLLTWC